MNSPKSVGYGWLAFTVAGCAGSYIGYRQWQAKSEDRLRIHREHMEKQQHMVAEANAMYAVKKRTKEASQTVSIPPKSENQLLLEELDAIEKKLVTNKS